MGIFKKIGLSASVAVAAMTLSATGAQAAAVVGPTTVNAGIETGANNSFTIGFSDQNLANPFSETLTFTTDVAGMIDILFNTVGSTAANNTNFTNAFLTGTGIAGQVFIPQILGDPNETRALNAFALTSPGTFTLTIQGTPGTQNGALGGTVGFTSMAAVPETGTWLMMLVGFGAMGYSMRRQRRSGSLLMQAA